MQTKQIAVWDGTGTPTDYQMKDRDWGNGDRVRVIAINQPRKVLSSKGWSSHTAHDGVLVVKLNADGTPAKKFAGWDKDKEAECEGQLVTDITIPRFIIQEWDTAADQIAAAAERKARQEEAKARQQRNAANLVTRANALIEAEGGREIHRYDVDQYGNVKLSVDQFRILVELAEGELASPDHDTRSQDS